jgi:hypothetical protein
MSRDVTQLPSNESLTLLSRILLEHRDSLPAESEGSLRWPARVSRFSSSEFNEFLALASSNHVIVRSFESCLETLPLEASLVRQWLSTALAAERARIESAVNFLRAIVDTLEEHSINVAVIKSLDHWPDLGSDLDLFTDAHPDDVCGVMRACFRAEVAPRSWGDRLAGKWNFIVPGLQELVEIHVGRLGQTGEQVAIAGSLLKNARWSPIDNQAFRRPSTSDRIMISTLQRMYRHFYFRLCDIVDTVALADAGAIDYDDLCVSAKIAGIWEGVATYLVIVSDYARDFRGTGLNLPKFVLSTARFGGEQVYFAKGFLRVPILPQCVRLYGSQLAGTLSRRELHSGARLSLLPWLATAAVVGMKITGSDKGIW